MYEGKEVARESATWTMRIDSITGRSLGPPQLVAKVPVDHGVFLSPDLQNIAFAQSHGWYVGSVTVAPAIGGPPRILASGIGVGRVRWNVDGTAVDYSAYPSESSTRLSRFRVPLSGGPPVFLQDEPYSLVDTLWDVRDLASGRTVAQIEFPSDVAPERSLALPGPSVVAAVRRVYPRGLRIVRLADGISRDVVDTTAEVGVPEWVGPDRLAVIVRRSGKTTLLLLRPDGSEARTLAFTNRPAFGGPLNAVVQFRVSPNGQYAAFVCCTDRGGLEVLDLASGRQRTLVVLSGNGRAPEGSGIGPIAWSGDSRSILYISNIWGDEPALRRVALSGADSLVRPLPINIYGPPSVTFPATAGNEFVEVAGARNERGVGSVALVPIDGSTPRVVFAQVAPPGPLSPDGKTLALLTPGPDGRRSSQITLVPVDGSSVRTVALPFVAIPGIKWHADGRLYALGRERLDGPVSLYVVPVDGTAPSVVIGLGASREDGAFALSPDGQFAAVTFTGTPRATFLRLQYDVPGALPLRRQ
jgi:hypothetical protein